MELGHAKSTDLCECVGVVGRGFRVDFALGPSTTLDPPSHPNAFSLLLACHQVHSLHLVAHAAFALTVQLSSPSNTTP